MRARAAAGAAGESEALALAELLPLADADVREMGVERRERAWEVEDHDLSVAAVGPVGLVVALRKILRDSAPLGKVAAVVLCLAAGWTLLAYISQVLIDDAPAADWWREFVVIALLPAIGVAHLLVAKRSPSEVRLDSR